MADKTNFRKDVMNVAVTDTVALKDLMERAVGYASNTEIGEGDFFTMASGKQAGQHVRAAQTAITAELKVLQDYVGQLHANLEATIKTTMENEAENRWQFVTKLEQMP